MYDLVVIGNPTFINGRLAGPSIYSAATAAKIGIEQMVIVSALGSDVIDAFIQGVSDLGIPEYFIIEASGNSVVQIQNPTLNLDEKILGLPSRIGIRDIPDEFLDAKVILLSPALQEIDAEFVEWICNSTDSLVFLDPQLRKLNLAGRLEIIREFSLAEKTQSFLDLIILNQLESELITGESDLYLAAELIVEWASETCIITLGKNGSLVYDGTEFSLIPSFPSQEVDPTEAGAVYLGAFAAESIAGNPLIDCCIYASTIASIKVENQGMEFSIDESEITHRTNTIADLVDTR